MKRYRSIISVLLAVLLLAQVFPMSIFAAVNDDGTNAYKNFVILGDSLCLGFSADVSSMTDVDTFDIISNIYRAANGHDERGEESLDYTHSYPTVFAKRIGIDTFQNNQVQNIFTPGDEYDDVFNFGVCAAWAGDLYDMLTDPFYVYPYFSQNYDATTTFVLPKDVVAARQVPINAPDNPYGIPSDGFDDLNPNTWEYVQIFNLGEDGFDPQDRSTWEVFPEAAIDTIDSVVWDFDWMTWMEGWVVYYKTEEYTIPAGTEINVNDNFYNVIMPNFYYVDKKCLDEDGVIMDTNGDGVIDNNDYYYYPSNEWGEAQTTKEQRRLYGSAVLNPQFTRYYYAYMVDKIRNGDLIALAAGGNDIYHTFMDQYMSAGMTNEDGSVNTLGMLLYLFNYAFQTNMKIGDILDLMAEPDALEGILAMFGIGYDMNAMNGDMGDMMVAAVNEDEGEDEEGQLLMAAPLQAAQAVPAQDAQVAPVEPAQMFASDGTALGTMFSPTEDYFTNNPILNAVKQFEEAAKMVAETVGTAIEITTEVKNNIDWLLDYYSSEKVTAYMEQEAIPNYKKNYEKLIQRVLELKDPSAELVLIGHYNPFGIKNYIQMMKMAMENGEFCNHMDNLEYVFKGFFGTLEKYRTLDEADQETLRRLITEDQDLLLKILADKDLPDDEIFEAMCDLTVPFVVLLMDRALGNTYEQFNGFVEEMGEKYGLACVDVSEAPCAGRYDPHPTKYGHEWIASRLYETVLPTITAAVVPEVKFDPCGCEIGKEYHGTITPIGVDVESDVANILRFRLNDSQTYSIKADEGYYIEAIFVDGELAYPSFDAETGVIADLNIKDVDINPYGLHEAEYSFNNLLKSHHIAVQFGVYRGPNVYAVEVLDSAAVNSGVGVYKNGDTVTLYAGEKDGYEFIGWQLVNGTAELDDFYSPIATFTMTRDPVKIRALWKVAEKYSFEVLDADPSTFGAGDYRPDDLVKIYAGNKEGYEFIGWEVVSGDVVLSDYISPFTTFVMPKEAVQIRALWKEIIKYPFEVVDGETTTYGDGDYLPGDVVTIYAGEKEGYYFAGWEVVEGDVVLSDYDNPITTFVMPEGPVQIRAKWSLIPKYQFEVLEGVIDTFGDGDYKAGEVVTIYAGVKEGYEFAGWEVVEGDVVLSDYDNPITTFVMPEGPVQIRAKWNLIPKYKFEMLDGDVGGFGNGEYKLGDLVVIYAGEKDGYEFVRWEVVEGDVDLDDYNSPLATFAMPEGPVKIRAIWKAVEPKVKVVYVDRKIIVPMMVDSTPKTTTITFNTNGGNPFPPMTVKFGEIVDLTKYIPYREGYQFGGWYSDSGFKNPVTSIKSDGTRKAIFAKWIPITYGITDCPRNEECPIFPFVDASPYAWYHDGVHYCLEKGLMIGVGDDMFAPFTTLSRAMIVTILYRQSGCPFVAGTSQFADVADGQWYTEACAWGDANGIILGYGNGNFGPNDPVTREQLAAIMHRYAAYAADAGEESVVNFYEFDDETVSDWAVGDVKWAEAVGLFDGVVGLPLTANAASNRAEVAMVLYNFCMRYTTSD